MKQYLAIASKLLTDKAWDTEWLIASQMFGVEKYIKQGRLLQSQHYSNDDYPNCVINMFNKMLEGEGEEKTKVFVDYILNEELKYVDEAFLEKNKYFISMLSINNSGLEFESIQFTFDKFLDLSEVPDEFYRDLQDEINKAYNFGLFSIIPFLVRKFMENLIIDILRRKYTAQNINLYYDTRNHKCHSFSTVIDNLNNNISDFKNIERNFDSNFINIINKYRDKGNSTAHSISIKFGTEEISRLKDQSEEIGYVLKLLIRVLSLI